MSSIKNAEAYEWRETSLSAGLQNRGAPRRRMLKFKMESMKIMVFDSIDFFYSEPP